MLELKCKNTFSLWSKCTVVFNADKETAKALRETSVGVLQLLL